MLLSLPFSPLHPALALTTAAAAAVLEVYALEIQMYSALNDVRRLKQLYRACLAVKSAIPHPRIMGVIRECGGKMWMGESASPLLLCRPLSGSSPD